MRLEVGSRNASWVVRLELGSRRLTATAGQAPAEAGWNMHHRYLIGVPMVKVETLGAGGGGVWGEYVLGCDITGGLSDAF